MSQENISCLAKDGETDLLMSENSENYEFIKQTRKDKPVNKKKLVFKFVYTVCLAVIFGFVAAICYTIGAHNFDEVFYPEKVKTVTIIEEEPETVDDISENESEDETEVKESDEVKETVINNIVEKVDLTVSDYETLYSELYDVAKEGSKSIVTVSCIDSDEEWFEDTVSSNEKYAGLVIADNGKELLILTPAGIVESANEIKVEFSNGEAVLASVKARDDNTNLSVIAVPLSSISKEAMETVKMATFGSTAVPGIVGKAVIAIGRPMGINDSIAYGFITSNSIIEQMTDTDVKLLTTDIYGSQRGSGVLINLRGKVLGIINTDYADADSSNMINALSISDIKPVIESMSNGKDRAMLGIYGTEISAKTKEEQDIPDGAYVTEIVMDSPAMDYGIQSGDIIVGINSETVNSFEDYKRLISTLHPGEVCRIRIKRFAQGEYKEVSFDVVLGTM